MAKGAIVSHELAGALPGDAGYPLPAGRKRPGVTGAVKAALRAVLPPALHPHALARARILRRSGGRVMTGPFAGTIHITGEDDFIEPGMLVGSYEKELHPAIETLLRAPPKLFVNVGASQGYYAVGFARRVPQARHVAFEVHEPRVAQLKRMAAANRVEVDFLGACTPTSLDRALALSDDAFVLIDVDGYEQELLDPAAVPGLRSARIIAETHDHIVPGITDELMRRFSPTHRIETVELGARTAADLPFKIRDPWTVRQLDEGRAARLKLLILTPHEAGATTAGGAARTGP